VCINRKIYVARKGIKRQRARRRDTLQTADALRGRKLFYEGSRINIVFQMANDAVIRYLAIFCQTRDRNLLYTDIYVLDSNVM